MNILSSRSHLWGPASARNTMFVLVTCLVLVGCLGCASTQSKYNEAAKTGTVDAYQQFISEHPESPLAASARMNIEKIAWGEALKTETVAGYERFKRSYPATEYPVDRKIEEFHWISAKGENSQKAIEAFIEQYPQGSHAAEAQRWLDVERDWRQLERNPELEALQGFVRTHGENRYSERAAELVETIEQEQAIRESLSVVSLKTSSKPINWGKKQVRRDGSQRRAPSLFLGTGCRGEITGFGERLHDWALQGGSADQFRVRYVLRRWSQGKRWDSLSVLCHGRGPQEGWRKGRG